MEVKFDIITVSLMTIADLIAAPGFVQSLNFSSINVTNITIEWDRVDCQERNGQIYSYRVIDYPTLQPDVVSTRMVIGTSNRMFTFTGLAPRTTYTFKVQAWNSGLHVPINYPASTITITTTAPKSELLYLTPS